MGTRDDRLHGRPHDRGAIQPAEVQDLVGRWWWSYDEGDFAVLAGLVTDDVHFTCRTDTGTTDYEDFVRADLHGREAVMAWQTQHRMDSPYPLRHHGTNVHLVAQHGDEARFASSLLVVHIAGGVAPLSSAVVHGAVRRVDGEVRIARLEVVLDTRESVPFRDR